MEVACDGRSTTDTAKCTGILLHTFAIPFIQTISANCQLQSSIFQMNLKKWLGSTAMHGGKVRKNAFIFLEFKKVL